MSALARSTDPITSHEAAASVRRISEQQNAILNALRQMGKATDLDLTAKLSWLASPQSVRSRRSELVRRGLVRQHETNNGPAYEVIGGRRHTVWEAV
jgi:DNA-binding Lrp family transcriptional regulator